MEIQKRHSDRSGNGNEEHIMEIAASAGLDSRYIELYGNYKAKVDYNLLEDKKDETPDGKVILVTAISPTPAGEGKTTTTVGSGGRPQRG